MIKVKKLVLCAVLIIYIFIDKYDTCGGSEGTLGEKLGKSIFYLNQLFCINWINLENLILCTQNYKNAIANIFLFIQCKWLSYLANYS